MKDHHHTSMTPGRPRMVISIEWLRAMVNEGKDDKDIVADLARQGIHVSPKTIQRRRIEFGMVPGASAESSRHRPSPLAHQQSPSPESPPPSPRSPSPPAKKQKTSPSSSISPSPSPTFEMTWHDQSATGTNSADATRSDADKKQNSNNPPKRAKKKGEFRASDGRFISNPYEKHDSTTSSSSSSRKAPRRSDASKSHTEEDSRKLAMPPPPDVRRSTRTASAIASAKMAPLIRQETRPGNSPRSGSDSSADNTPATSPRGNDDDLRPYGYGMPREGCSKSTLSWFETMRAKRPATSDIPLPPKKQVLQRISSNSSSSSFDSPLPPTPSDLPKLNTAPFAHVSPLITPSDLPKLTESPSLSSSTSSPAVASPKLTIFPKLTIPPQATSPKPKSHPLRLQSLLNSPQSPNSAFSPHRSPQLDVRPPTLPSHPEPESHTESDVTDMQITPRDNTNEPEPMQTETPRLDHQPEPQTKPPDQSFHPPQHQTTPPTNIDTKSAPTETTVTLDTPTELPSNDQSFLFNDDNPTKSDNLLSHSEDLLMPDGPEDGDSPPSESTKPDQRMHEKDLSETSRAEMLEEHVQQAQEKPEDKSSSKYSPTIESQLPKPEETSPLSQKEEKSQSKPVQPHQLQLQALQKARQRLRHQQQQAAQAWQNRPATSRFGTKPPPIPKATTSPTPESPSNPDDSETSQPGNSSFLR